MMLLIRYIFLPILCLSLAGCATVEEVTVIRESLIVPSKIQRPAPPAVPQSSAKIQNNIPQDIEDGDFDDSEQEDSDTGYSKKPGLELDRTEHNALITAIEEWMGTRYQMGGCSKSGVDCSCFVKAVYRKAYNFELERSSGDIFAQDLMPVSINNMKTGDLLFFRSKSGRIFHVGIYLKENKFAHVSRIRGVKISNLDYFRNSLFSAKRLKNAVISKKLG